MARRHKKSFFERLTGSVSVGNDDYDQESHDDYEEFDDGFTDEPDEIYETEDWTAQESQQENFEDEGELAVDVYETTEHIIVQAMVAGVRPDHLDVSITREMCTISGRREAPQDAANDDYLNRELYWGSFSRSVVLPAEVEVEESQAKEDHGLLTVKMPKINKDQQTKLEVQVG
jgi:HSP20 family protein